MIRLADVPTLALLAALLAACAAPAGAASCDKTCLEHIAPITKACSADMLWTGVNSEKVTAPPQFVEQGREHDDLVKRGGAGCSNTA